MWTKTKNKSSIFPRQYDTWISALQDYLYLMGANERQSVAYAATLLQGAARVWWDSYLYDQSADAPRKAGRIFGFTAAAIPVSHV